MYEIVLYYQVRFRTFFVQKWTTNVYVILSGGILCRLNNCTVYLFATKARLFWKEPGHLSH